MWRLPLLMWKCCKDAESAQKSLKQEQFPTRSAAARVCSRLGGNDLQHKPENAVWWKLQIFTIYSLYILENEYATQHFHLVCGSDCWQAVAELTCLHDVGHCALLSVCSNICSVHRWRTLFAGQSETTSLGKNLILICAEAEYWFTLQASLLGILLGNLRVPLTSTVELAWQTSAGENLRIFAFPP